MTGKISSDHIRLTLVTPQKRSLHIVELIHQLMESLETMLEMPEVEGSERDAYALLLSDMLLIYGSRILNKWQAAKRRND